MILPPSALSTTPPRLQNELKGDVGQLCVLLALYTAALILWLVTFSPTTITNQRVQLQPTQY
jgi:hypothetical protein